MPPPTPDTLYTDRDSIEDLLSDLGVELALDDDMSGTESAAETLRVAPALAVATATINRYCSGIYEPSQLDNSWSVWDWTTTLAAVWLMGRRGNTVPKSLKAREAKVIAALEAVRDGRESIEDAERRTASVPAVSNFVIDPTYRGKQIRVQRQQTDRTPRDNPVAVDYPGEFIREP